MQVTILTLPFDPATGGFRTEPLDALRRRCEIVRVQPAFFTHQETAYWTLVVTHRLRAAPEEAAVRRGVDRATLPASAAAPGGSVAGAPSTGGDLRSDLRTDPRGDPKGDLLSAADAALYQELPLYLHWVKFLDWLLSRTEKFPRRMRLSSTAQREWPRFTDRGRVCGLSRSPSGSAVPRLVTIARGVAVSVGAVLLILVDPAERACDRGLAGAYGFGVESGEDLGWGTAAGP